MMSANTSKITIYSSPQAEHLTTSSAADLSVVNHVPRRMAYRIKISNSKQLEALSTAAKQGLTSWVGGQKVRIVDIVRKDCTTGTVAGSRVSTSQSSSVLDSVNCSVNATFAPYQTVSRYTSVTNGIYSTGKSLLHPRCSTASVAITSARESCSSSTCSGTIYGYSVAHAAAFQSYRTSKSHSLSTFNHCQALKAKPYTENSLMHCGSGFINSLVWPSSHGKLVSRSSVLQGLQRFRIRYLGAVAGNSHIISADSAAVAKGHSSTALQSQSVTKSAVMSDVKTVTAGLNGSSNNHLLYAQPMVNSSQPFNPILQSSQAISDRGLKRSYTDDERTVVSPKRMRPSVTCFSDNSVSDAAVSGTQCRPLTSRMLNSVTARLSNCDQYTATSSNCSLSPTNGNCRQQTMEVNNNCTSHLKLLQDLVPKLRLPLGSGC